MNACRSEFGMATKTLERHLMERQQQHVPTSRGVNPGPPRVIDIKKYLANSNTWGVRDDASPPKSVPGDQAYLSDVETNAGGRMYRTESGKY